MPPNGTWDEASGGSARWGVGNGGSGRWNSTASTNLTNLTWANAHYTWDELTDAWANY